MSSEKPTWDEINLTIITENQKQWDKVARVEPIGENVLHDDLVKRAWGILKSKNWVQFHVMSSPCELFHYRKGNEIVSGEIIPKTRKLKVYRGSWHPPTDVNSTEYLQWEIDNEILSDLKATEIALEIDREIIGDLKNNAGVVDTCSFLSDLDEKIQVLREKIARNIAEFYNESDFEQWLPNWAVVNSERQLKIDGLTVYKDIYFPENKILLGYKGDEEEVGYVFAPYIFLCGTPRIPEPGSCSDNRFISRYGKKLMNANFYGLLTIE